MSPRKSNDRWIRDEATFADITRHVLRRALRRPIRTLAMTILFAGLLLGYRLRKQPTYVATAVIRVSEGVVTDASPRPTPALAHYIWLVALNRPRLAEIMKKHGSYGSGGPTDHQMELFKGRLGITVTSNYFHDYVFESLEAGTRSALVTLEFPSGDPETARSVVHDIVTSFVDSTENLREERVATTREMYATAIRGGRARVEEMERERSRLVTGLDGASESDRDVQMTQNQLIKEAFERELLAMESRAAETELVLAAETQRIGLSFELVTEDLQAFAPKVAGKRVVILFAILFMIALPICVVVGGAFDRRIYDREDLVFLGMPVIGVLPRFNGDSGGSLRARLRRARNLRV